MRLIDRHTPRRAFIPLPSHLETLDRIGAWVETGERWGIVSGEPGIGKSTLLRESARRLRSPHRRVFQTSGTDDTGLFAQRIGQALGIVGGEVSWGRLELGFKAAWLQGLSTLLVVDDADSMMQGNVRERLGSLASMSDGRLTVLAGCREVEAGELPTTVIRPLTRSESVLFLEAAFGEGLEIGPKAHSRLHSLAQGIPARLERLVERCRRLAAEHGESLVTPDLLETALSRSEGWASGWYPDLLVG